MGCLIAEITKGSPKLVVQQGLWQKLLAGDRAEMWELENSNFFIRGLTMASNIQITGSTQRTNREGEVNWRFTLLTDRATEGVGGIVTLEAKGVPLGYRSQTELGDMVRPFRMLLWILSDGIKAGDPNIVSLDVTGLTGCPPPETRISGHKGIFNVHMVMWSPPPSPQSGHPQRDTARAEGLGRDMRRTRLARSTDKEERA